jgi:hypothetical protein
MSFARWVFGLGGALGLLVLLPLFFLEAPLAERFPPALTHPEHYYAFIGVATAWQLVYLVIAGDPVRYRAIMPIGALGKLSFVVSAHALWLQGRAPFAVAATTWLDLVLAVLFLIAYARIPTARA